MILLSDAMVLMDLGYVQGIDALASIAPSVEVLDVVLQECQHDLQPNLVRDIQAAGIKEVSSDELTMVADAYRTIHDKLSFQDSLCLHYAKENKRVLLTNEKQLRARCEAESVQAHGTIWVMEQTHAHNLRTKEQLCQWISILSRKDRRMPKDEIARLIGTFGCQS